MEYFIFVNEPNVCVLLIIKVLKMLMLSEKESKCDYMYSHFFFFENIELLQGDYKVVFIF